MRKTSKLDRGDRRVARRRTLRQLLLLLLLMLPAIGCATPPRLPWNRPQPVAEQAEEGRVAASEQPMFRTASFRTQSLQDSSDLISTADAIINAATASDLATQLAETDLAARLQIDQGLSEPDLAPSTIDPPLPEPVRDTTPLSGDAGVHPMSEGVISSGQIPSDHIPSVDVPQIIDLGSALGMAGGNAWTIQLARQRTVEAHADLQQARALWLPTLQFGVGWNNHGGRIQATDGQILEVSRSSLFVGGGATLGDALVAGGSGGPFRLFADLALSDAFFAPKIAVRQLSARNAGVSVAKNQALLDAGIAYVDLLEAAGRVADAHSAIAAADELLHLTQTFADAGAGALADVDRAATERARLQQQLHDANRLHRTRSANLARRLRLDPRLALQPADQIIVPIELTADSVDVDSLVATALGQRPELIEISHEIAGLCLAVKQAHVDPWVPRVTMASSAGTFGGGQGSSLDERASRSDVDLQAVWELDSMGLGVAARKNRAGSQLAQQRTLLSDLRDEIKADVVAAYEDVVNYRAQIDTANEALALAEASYQRNLQRVRADEGLPIELLQAINAKNTGLQDRTSAVANYNRSQLRLLFATGQLRH